MLEAHALFCGTNHMENHGGNDCFGRCAHWVYPTGHWLTVPLKQMRPDPSTQSTKSTKSAPMLSDLSQGSTDHHSGHNRLVNSRLDDLRCISGINGNSGSSGANDARGINGLCRRREQPPGLRLAHVSYSTKPRQLFGSTMARCTDHADFLLAFGCKEAIVDSQATGDATPRCDIDAAKALAKPDQTRFFQFNRVWTKQMGNFAQFFRNT